MIPTVAGELYLGSAARIATQIGRLNTEMRMLTQELTGALRVAFSTNSAMVYPDEFPVKSF